MSDAQRPFTWNIFYKGAEGFKEHIQAHADSGDELAERRTSVISTLTELGATPEYSAPQRGSQAPTGDSGAEKAALEVFGKVCPVHNVQMRPNVPADRNGGNPVVPGKTWLMSKAGKKYLAFWSCPEKNVDGSYCKGE